MQFSFEEEDVYLPEKADWYTSWGVSTVDFIWKKSSVMLVVIEAKTSAPNFQGGTKEDQIDYTESLFNKFNAALFSIVGLTIGTPNYAAFDRHGKIHQLETLQNEIKLVLIIKTAKTEWLTHIDAAFKKSTLFQNLLKSTGCKLQILNPDLARKQGLQVTEIVA